MRLVRLFAIVSAGLVGCGGDSTGAPDAAPQTPDAGPPLLEPPPEGDGLQLRMEASVTSGQEITYCQYYVLPAGAGLDIDKFEHRYSQGSHHMLLFPTSLTAAEVALDLDRFVCNSRGDLKNLGVAYGAQEAEGMLQYPSGVAMHFDSEEVVLLQAHYINTGEATIDAEVLVNLWYATVPITAYAGTIFYYDWAILIPPDPGTATVRMQCVVPDDITMLFASSHMHRRGVGYRSWLTGGALPQPLELHMTDQWEPDPTTFEPPIQITGGQVIEYECDFQNDLTQTVIEGASAETNEMCMFVAGYYPKMSDAAEFCFVPGGSGPMRSGSKTCAETLTCMQGTADPVAQEQCIMDTCEASSLPFNDFVFCLIRNNCVGDPTCIANNCATEYGACNSAACL